MGKLDVSLLRYLTKADFKILAAIETGMRRHELVPAPLAASLARLSGSGISKMLRDLCSNKLLSYERGKRYDGYRLTNQGYDYLALRNLVQRNIVASFGNEIGVGKESNIYTVANDDGEEMCLKLHRLGRTCFRRVKEKRDYHKNKKESWLRLSRKSATKEFAYMTALYNREFPVPKPYGLNRHCVIMERIDGTQLNHISELEDVEKLYDELMNLIVQFAECGVIHCDFNEFNIMITEDEKPIIIDFPQMMSTEHEDAEMHFNRDVECVRDFFRKRFRFESETFPTFTDINRVDALDADILCTGMNKKIAKEIRKILDECDDAASDTEDEPKELSNSSSDREEDNSDAESEDSEHSDQSMDGNASSSDKFSDEHSLNVPKSKSVYSTATSIPLEEIKKRAKKEHLAKERREQGKSSKAKGLASVVTRTRRENKNTIKQSKGIWGYE